MDSFIWGPTFITGIDKVDSQHQGLVTMVNDYGSALAEDSIDESFLIETFRSLTSYAQEHFTTEEALMAEANIDRRHLHYHAQQHAQFVEEVIMLAQTISTKNRDDCKLLLDYLIRWLTYHILGSDQNMARQLIAIERGESPKNAYLAEEKKSDSSTEPLLAALSGLFEIVSKRNRDLFELNRTLEKRVEERTKDLAEANAALEVISVTDHLTGLPNRRFAMQQLQLHWEESQTSGQSLSCLMIDADGFKEINDRYGHDAGDVVLVTLARELKHSCRSDDIVCRLGGDEFLIICPYTNLEGALKLGEQTRARISSMEVPAGDGFWNGSISVGAGVRSAEMDSTDDLLKAADEAVYIAKRDGRNCVRASQK
ncbi:MAG: GGDEF domain-containing protein [Desulfobulbaceae bacterium]|nr:MAG: GGDEF domain-containing protein [Desulfobulbaceae bacterium]